jgi:hypothetical protein
MLADKIHTQMKIMSVTKTLLCAIMVLGIASCKKENRPAAEPRKIKCILYTEEDFSGFNDNITFSLFIRNQSATLFDSALATMRVRDIPSLANKLIFEKLVSGNDQSLLTAGFRYTIENTGISWYIDTVAAGQSSKVINFSFE